MDIPFKVSVRLISYNHEKFIAQAIEGVLAQKTNFPVELIIGDDFSTDKTLQIAEKYISTPAIAVRILRRQKGDTYWITRQKLGRLFNNTNTLSNCTGKYVALLDGDDIWIDPYKLQKQVDFLEAHEDFVICFHDINKCWTSDNGESYITEAPNIKREVSTFENLCEEGSFMQTSSIVFKNGLIKEFPKWYYNAPYGDWPLYLMLAEHGKIEKLPYLMSSHREHSGGIVNTRWKGSAFGVQILKMIKVMDNHYTHKYKKLFYAPERLKLLYTMALLYSRDTKNVTKAWYYTFKLMLLSHRDYKLTWQNIKRLLAVFRRTLLLKNTPKTS